MNNINENQIPPGLVLAVLPLGYPNATFTHQAKEQMENMVRAVANINFLSSILQKGIWRTKFPNEESKVQFLEAILQLQPQFEPFEILSFGQIPAIVHQARIPGRNLTDHKILVKMSKDNEGMNTSHWIILERIQEDEEIVIHFQIDLESFQYLQGRT